MERVEGLPVRRGGGGRELLLRVRGQALEERGDELEEAAGGVGEAGGRGRGWWGLVGRSTGRAAEADDGGSLFV